jgi:hypothetical protein
MNNDELWRHQDIDFDDDDDDLTRFSITRFCQNTFEEIVHASVSVFYTVLHNPAILIVSVSVFVIVLIAGLFAVQAQAAVFTNDLQNNAEDVARSAGTAFSKALDDAGRGPLFSMSQFVKRLDEFKILPHEIGQVNNLVYDGYAPPLAGKEATHRDISKTSASSQAFLDSFNDIAESIKMDADLGKILVGLQLAPVGVVSAIHPLVNYDDFESPIYMNNTGAIGHDLIRDSRRVGGARQTLKSQKPVVVGPLTLIQGDFPVVQEAFIMRLAINMEGYLINVPAEIETDPVESFESWGFAVAIINWENAKIKTGLYERFAADSMEFSLTRNDLMPDGSLKVIITYIPNIRKFHLILLTQNLLCFEICTLHSKKSTSPK